MSFVAVAIGGSALIGGVSSVIAGNKAAGAQQDAANQSTALQQDQLAEDRRQYDTNRADLAPYRTSGNAALGKLSDLLGLGTSAGNAVDWEGFVKSDPAAYQDWLTNHSDQSLADYGQYYYKNDLDYHRGNVADASGNTYQGADPNYAGRDLTPFTRTGGATGGSETGALDRSFTLADFNKDPGYEFRRSEGERGVEASAAARGGALSGGALKAIARYNQDAASQEYGAAYNRFNNDTTTRYNRLAAVAGIGQTATNSGIAAGNTLQDQQQTGVNNITSNLNASGNARASQYVNTGNAIGSAANNVGQYFALKDLYKTPNIAGSAAKTIASNPGIF